MASIHPFVVKNLWSGVHLTFKLSANVISINFASFLVKCKLLAFLSTAFFSSLSLSLGRVNRENNEVRIRIRCSC